MGGSDDLVELPVAGMERDAVHRFRHLGEHGIGHRPGSVHPRQCDGKRRQRGPADEPERPGEPPGAQGDFPHLPLPAAPGNHGREPIVHHLDPHARPHAQPDVGAAGDLLVLEGRRPVDEHDGAPVELFFPRTKERIVLGRDPAACDVVFAAETRRPAAIRELCRGSGPG